MARPYSILIVDDEADIRDLLARTLQEPGFRIYTAADAFEAVRVLVEHPVDLVVSDVRMPEMSGFEFARQAKLMRPNIHFIFVSGYYRQDDAMPARVAGPLLTKPFRPDELRKVVARELRV